MIKKIASFVLLIALCMNGSAQTANIKQFMNMRFGMFIHWGPVSLKGTEIGWSRGSQVPVEEYDNLYKTFNPVLFDADAWVKTAKDAGMKYLTITARHHDGFCLWPSAFTDYDIMAGPYKKDIVGALAEACKKQGIRFCIYYSILDWHHPDYPIHSPKDQRIDTTADMGRYVTFMKNQLKELITKYDPYMLWFEGGWEKPWTDEMGRDMYAYLKSLKPDVIINNRLGKEIAAVANKKIDVKKMVGDYDTPEQTVGRMNMVMPWESCFTICKQWSWKPDDKMKTLKTCLNILSRTSGGNGNLLLNVGPMPDGRIEARQAERLKEIGGWLKKNGEAVYGTLGGPYAPSENYAATRKGNRIFLHILNAEMSELVLKTIAGRKIVKASVLNGRPVHFSIKEGNIHIPLPAALKGAEDYIIVLELDGDAEELAVIS
ncbi:MAG: alpha-L-fucosidase [Chitinophaga sp.]